MCTKKRYTNEETCRLEETRKWKSLNEETRRKLELGFLDVKCIFKQSGC